MRKNFYNINKKRGKQQQNNNPRKAKTKLYIQAENFYMVIKFYTKCKFKQRKRSDNQQITRI